MLGAVELVGMPVQFGGPRVYAFGELSAGTRSSRGRASPVGRSPEGAWEAVSAGWFVPLQVASGAVTGLLVAAGVGIANRSDRG